VRRSRANEKAMQMFQLAQFKSRKRISFVNNSGQVICIGYVL